VMAHVCLERAVNGRQWRWRVEDGRRQFLPFCALSARL
jgi:hypothetical protein